ncbi:MAG: hypothetical protein KGJ86_10925 [Chloroflexota bacterium]|nr:hypothetical protein [Chloroflexota bacterium]
MEEVRARQAEQRMTARIVAGLPFVVLVILRTVDPGYFAIFDTPTGQLILGVGLLSLIFGYVSMLWITRLPVENRALAAGRRAAP